MLRPTLAIVLLGLAYAAKLHSCGSSGGYCYGYIGSGTQNWCWLTTDGKKNYETGTGRYSCSSYNGYQDGRYCEDAKSKHGEDTHTSETKNVKSMTGGGASGAGNSGGGGSGSKCATGAWSCPSSWTTGGQAPNDAKDAKAFIATNNVYRCMHNVQAVVWDDEVHASAKQWAQHTGKSMHHSHGSWCPKSDGENLAGTFTYSKKPGVDATHMWYSEIQDPCHFRESCFKSFNAGHFTAMMWKTVNKIAYSDTTGELAVGRYRGCDKVAPNMQGQWNSHLTTPKYNWAQCVKKVLKCPAFSGLKEDDLEGCDSSSAWSSDTDWHMVYKTKCKAKYANIVRKVARLYNIPEVFQPLFTNPWPVAAVCGLTFAAILGIAARRSWARGETALLTGEDEGPEAGLE